MKKYIAVFTRSQTTAKLKQFLGQEWLVVPVVAMIEGVRFGANQEMPELGLAEDFGKYPVSWNNRPLTIGHPQIDGQFVSANTLSVLEDFSFGMTMNARVEDKKLKMDAYVNLTRAAELSEAQAFVDRINAGDIVEVSVGFFTEVENLQGTYDNQDYSGVWRNIVPDHLAFLQEGTIGACSVKDGCGVPRINKEHNMPQTFTTLEKQPAIKVNCEGCGGACKDNKTQTTTIGTVKVDLVPQEKMYSRVLATKIFAQEGSTGILDSNVYTLIKKALEEKFGYYDVYMFGFTSQKAVYERYGDGWKVFQCTYNIDNNGTVTLAEDEEEVNLITQIIPKQKEASMVTVQENQEQEQKTPETEEQPAVVEQPIEITEEVVEEVTEQPVAQTQQITTLENALASLSEMDRVRVNEGLRIYDAQKTSIINVLKSTGRCDFNDSELSAMTLQSLEKLASLAKVPSFEGRAAPVVHESKTDNLGYVPAPRAFETKKAS